MRLALLALVFGALQASVAWAIPSLPAELVTFDKLAEDVRSPLSSKMSEMRMTYQVREVPQGPDATRIDFISDAGSKLMASVFLTRFMNADKSERQEVVHVRAPNGQTLFKETILTIGSKLEYSDATKKIFFETKNAGYELKENETWKSVSIQMDNKEPFRFVSTRSGPAKDCSNVLSDIYYGGAKILTLSDILSGDDTVRSLEYTMHGTRFMLSAFGWNWGGYGWPTFKMKVVSSKPRGNLIDNIRYYYDGREVFGLNFFLKLFGGDMYTFLVGQAANQFLNGVISETFPATQRVATIGKSDRFLDELNTLKAQLAQAAATSNWTLVTSTVTVAINDFIAAIQNGTLGISDTRPAKK